MPNLNDMFPSKYLKAEDLRAENGKGWREFTLTMIEIAPEEMGGDDSGEKDSKWVLRFANAKKGLVLNKTNAASIAEVYGENTDDWIGNKVILFVTTVSAFGQAKPGIRVRIPPVNLEPAFDPDAVKEPA